MGRTSDGKSPSTNSSLSGTIIRLLLLSAVLSFVPVIIGRWWVGVDGDVSSFTNALRADLVALYEGGEATSKGRQGLDEVRITLERFAREHQHFKELSETGTVSRETFDKLKAKAMQIAAELVRSRSELDKYRSDARLAVSAQLNAVKSGTSAAAQLNATYAAALQRAADQLSTLKRRVRSQEEANERLEHLLAKASEAGTTKAERKIRVPNSQVSSENSQDDIDRKEQIASLEKEAEQMRTDLLKVQQSNAVLEEENRYIKSKLAEEQRRRRDPLGQEPTVEESVKNQEEIELETESGSGSSADDSSEDDNACLRRAKELSAQISVLNANNTRLKRAGAKILKTKQGLDSKVKDLQVQLKTIKDQLNSQRESESSNIVQQAPKAQVPDEFSQLGFGAPSLTAPRAIHEAQNDYFSSSRQGVASADNANGYNTYTVQAKVPPSQSGQLQRPQQPQQGLAAYNQPSYGQFQNFQQQPPSQQGQLQQPQYSMYPAGLLQSERPPTQFSVQGQGVPSVYSGLGAAQSSQQYGNGQVSAQPVGGCSRKFEFNSDRPGGHYRQQQVDSARRCRDLCLQEYQCQSWVYVKAQAGCYLKNSVFPPIDNPCCVSGPRC